MFIICVRILLKYSIQYHIDVTKKSFHKNEIIHLLCIHVYIHLAILISKNSVKTIKINLKKHLLGEYSLNYQKFCFDKREFCQMLSYCHKTKL